MPWPDPITLRGQHARLEPLSKEHREGLVEAVKDGDLSTIWYTAIPTPENVAKEIDRRLGLQAAGSMLPFTVFDAGGRERAGGWGDFGHERCLSPSLRGAKRRSNPGCLRGRSLDCFASLAMTASPTPPRRASPRARP